MTRFYDTCSLLFLQQKIFEDDSIFYISDITIEELEKMKESYYKDEDTKYKARKIIHLLDENREKYKVVFFEEDLESKNWNNDKKIITCARKLSQQIPDLIFITEDMCCDLRATNSNLNTLYCKEDILDDYTGYKIVDLSDTDLANFYTSFNTPNNEYNLCENQYLIIKNKGVIVDKYVWRNNQYKKIDFYAPESKMFGKIKPRDTYQELALHSLYNNQMTMLRGAAGTGKSLLAFGYMFSLLEKGEIDKIVVFCNTVATKGSAKLGFYPGDRTEKLLDSQIGNLLISKLGDRCAVERLIEDGDLVLLPMSDIRGYDTTGMKAAIYISEAQNLDIELMRLAIQRVGEDSRCIIDGDFNHQVDMSMYAGVFNGMRRASKVFRNHKCYGEVELVKIYRSELAEIAEQL